MISAGCSSAASIMGQLISLLWPPSEEPAEDHPFIHAIRNPEVLDWKRGLSSEEIAETLSRQTPLPVEVAPWLLLGNQACACDLERLTELGVTHVLNLCGRTVEGVNYADCGITAQVVEAEDEEGYQMVRCHFENAREFVNAARRENPAARVLVHCVAGINRSGLIVAALYMVEQRVTVLDVVAHVRMRRGNIALCNESFQAQLVALARRENLLGVEPGAKGSALPAAPAGSARANRNKAPSKSIRTLF